MQEICCKLNRTAAVVLMFMVACVGSAWGQYKGGVPWQTGDVAVCSQGGTCNVLRVVNGSAVLLDQFFDNLGGNSYGVGINNTLHVVATDDANSGSKVVVYTVGSLNANVSPPTPIAHTPVLYQPSYDTSGGVGIGGSMVRAVAINNAGNIFALNSTGTNGPNIVEIGPGPGQTPVATFSLSGCKDSQGNALTQATSMDLSAAADANGNSLYAYVTSGGTIQQIKFSDGSCTKFADFGSNVMLNGIRDIPPGALGNVTPSCNGAACPTDEALLVVTIGDTDPDAAETGESSPDPDAINVCTNQPLTTSAPVSCALLIDTNPTLATLTAPLWKAGIQYPGGGNVNTIIDPKLHLQNVFTAGTSGTQEPAFDEGGGTVIDNAVKWTDISPQPTWLPSHPYTIAGTQPPLPTMAAVAGTFLVDPNGNLQTVTTPGTSGPSQPTWSMTSGGTTTDGLQWQRLGTLCDPCTSPWAAGIPYSAGAVIDDNTGVEWTAITSGTSGNPTRPSFETNEGTGTILADNAVIWAESRPARLSSTAYVVNAIVLSTPGTPGAHVEQVSLLGTTGPGTMVTPFSTNGGTVIDGLQWKNQTSPAVAVVARYPVNTSTTLQSLALDPLIVNCTTGCNFPLPALQVSSAITSPGANPTLTAPGFWLGDNQYPNVYKLDFASGTAVQFSANAPIDTNLPGTPCSTCTPLGRIQGVGIYGSEGANQPGLAKLLFNNTAAPPNTERASFPSSSADPANVLNSLALTLYNGSSPAASLLPFAVYASAVAPNSCFDDSTGNPSCLATFQPGAFALPIMWKMDVPLPSSGSLALSSTQTLVGNFDFPTNFQSLSNDVTLDSQFDVTTLVGLDSPIYRSPSTSHGSRLKSANGQPENNYNCSYNSPVISPSKNCYANPGTLPIKFSCSNLGRDSLSNYGVTPATPWGPTLQIIEFGPPPVPSPFPPASGGLCDGTANTGSAPSQANANNLSNTAPILAPGGCETAQLPSSNHATTYTFKSSMWTYNWQVQSTSAGVVYQVCTFDDSNGSWDKTSGRKGTPFCTLPFYVKNSCP